MTGAFRGERYAKLTSSRPYLIRAIYEWIVDNDLTPQLVVDAQAPGVDVPRAYVSEGQIVLNVSTTAVRALELGIEQIRFDARFAGQATAISFPTRAVKAILARENGAGMSFPAEEPEGDPPEGPAGPETDKTGRPALRVVK